MQLRLEACNFTICKIRNQVIESYKSHVNFSYKAKKTAYIPYHLQQRLERRLKTLRNSSLH